MVDLEDIFGPDGPLQRSLPDFRFRRQQLRMAERVMAAMTNREALVVEAGTGTGKTFAYLVPALLSGKRVLISTGTRTLQDQLFAKDLPLLSAALGRPARVALLKGRANYLCRLRLAQAGEQLALEGMGQKDRTLARLSRWALATRTGDLAEVAGLSDSHPVWPQVTSTRDNCLGARCEEFSRCHVAIARRTAQEADVVVVNHHLLLADLALKEDGFGDILGSADAVILDEAHQIPDLATQFFGASFSSRRIENVVRDVQGNVAGAVRHSAELAANGWDGQVSEALRAVSASVASIAIILPRQQGRFAWAEAPANLTSLVEDLAHALHDLATQLQAAGEDSPLSSAAERVSELALVVERIGGLDDLDGTRAVEVSARGFTLSLLPFDVAVRFQAMIRARPCAWIFTSATLSLGEDFSHFTSRLGLAEAETLKIDSPFNYETQSILYLPQGMPEPQNPAYIEAVIEQALPLIRASQGGAFVLFTSHRALSKAAQILRDKWADETPYNLYVQGEAPRERLLKEFREDGFGVLLGTTSFWEGVDVKGEALRLVIIEKLPFASPDDPVVKARIDHLQATGANAFRDYQLPEAALALKQGVGRLIRSEEDYGAVVICDPRLVGKNYGRVFVAALPPMPVTREADEAVRFLRKHSPDRGRVA
ncbi:MAG TPA: ATP-dependent DNA helicase [Steroidobacteraceae bacterium]|jgi:ATP-dependent DNA helicase DinG|nr:ATP-dependent DNA helicase [Steroidobacteraceae bacterium]